MTKFDGEKLRKIISLLGILLLSALLSTKIVHDQGEIFELPNWEVVSGDLDGGLAKNGNVFLKNAATLVWHLPKEIQGENLKFRVTLRCDWIGQLFFSVGGEEIYFLFPEIRDFLKKGSFKIDLFVENGQLSGEIVAGERVNLKVHAPSPVEKFQIRVSQSDFYLESVAVFDGQTDRELAYENFGPDFNFLNIFILTIIIFLLILLALRTEAFLLGRFFHRDKRELTLTFITAYMPFAFALLLLNKDNFISISDDLFVLIIYRLILAFLFTGKGSLTSNRILKKVICIISVGLGCYLVAAIAYFSEYVTSTVGIILFISGLLGITLMALLLFKKNLDNTTFGPWVLVMRLWLFLAIANIVFKNLPNKENVNAIGYFLLFCSVYCGYRILWQVRKNLRCYQIYAFVFVILMVVCFEGVLRTSPYETRFRPMNIGRDFEEDLLLFWAPSSLFDNVNPLLRTDDFEVRKIALRSGPALKEKEKGVFRILTLGGSNTWGQWIEDPEKVWSEVLEKELAKNVPSMKFEVLNGGVKGYNLFQLMVLYKYYLADYDVDMIILYVNINDRAASARKGMYTYRELFQIRNSDKWEAFVTDNTTINKANGPPSWVAGTQKYLQKFSIYNALVKVVLAYRSSEDGGRSLDPNTIKSLNPISDYVANLNEFVNVGKEGNIGIVFADEYSYAGNGNEKIELDIFQNAMINTAEKNHIPFFPANSYLRSNYDDNTIVFPFDTVHLNEKGSQVLGQALARFLVDKKLLTEKD